MAGALEPDSGALAKPEAPTGEAEARLLTLDDIEKMGGTDFDGGVGDYLLRNDLIEAVVLAIGETPDFGVAYAPENLPSRGVLIDIGTRGQRNDQFDELHQAINFDWINDRIQYFGADKDLPAPSFENEGATASITVHGFASLSFGGKTYATIDDGTLPVVTTYSVTRGNPWIDISTVVTNTLSKPVPLITVGDVDITAGKGRMAFQPFPGLGPVPDAKLDPGNPLTYAQWSYLVMPGNNRPEDGPANNDGSPAGEVCYAYAPTAPETEMVGYGFNLGSVTSKSFDLNLLAKALGGDQAAIVPLLLLPGETRSYDRRLFVASKNTVDACLSLMRPQLAPSQSVLVQGRVVAGNGKDAGGPVPVKDAHVFFDNTQPGSPSYPAGRMNAPEPGSPLPVTHAITEADGRFEAHLPVGSTGAWSFTGRVQAPLRETVQVPQFSLTVAQAGSTLELDDVKLGGTGTLQYKVQSLEDGQLGSAPVKLSIYGTGGTTNPDFGAQYLSWRDYPDVNPWAPDADTNEFAETFASSPSLNFVLDADGSGSIDLSPGTYEVYASRGLEYTLGKSSVTIGEDDVAVVDLTIERVVASDSLVSLDAHVHGVKSYDASQPLTSRALSLAAAGVEIMVGTDHDYVTDYAPVIRQLGLETRIRSIIGLESSGVLPVPPGPWTGGLNAFPQAIGHWGSWPAVVIPGARRNGAIQDELLNPATVIDRLRGANSLPALGARPSTATLDQWLQAIQAGKPGTPGEKLAPFDEIVVFNHPRATKGGIVEIGLLHTLNGKAEDESLRGYDPSKPISAFPNQLMKLPSAYHKHHHGEQGTDTDGMSFDAIELLNGGDQGHYTEARADWFSFLDQNIRRTGVANSDSHRSILEAPGIGRTFVAHQSPDPMTMDVQELIDNVRAMRAIGTSGPILRVGVEGDVTPAGADPLFFNIGEEVRAKGGRVTAHIRVEAPNWIPVEEIRIFRNGMQIQTVDIPTANVLNGPTIRYQDTVVLAGIDRDSYLTFEAGIKLGDDGKATSPDLLALMRKVMPRTSNPFAFTNPVFVDGDGNGYHSPGLPRE